MISMEGQVFCQRAIQSKRGLPGTLPMESNERAKAYSAENAEEKDFVPILG
jgi:hypothetical protein